MNLACAEEGAFFVQMAYSNFGSQIAVTGSISAQFTIIDTVDAPYGRDQVVVDISDQTFAPTLSASQTNVLGLTASPAPNQHAIRELYQAEVNKPPEERFFFMTANPKAVLGAYLSIPYRWHRWIVVPDERKREFADFVYRVSFYDPQASAAARPRRMTLLSSARTTPRMLRERPALTPLTKGMPALTTWHGTRSFAH